MSFSDWVTKEHTLHESIKELFSRIGEMVSSVSLVETHYSEISKKIILYKGMGIDEIPPVSVDMYFQAELKFDGDVFSSISSTMFPVTFEDLNSGMGELSIPPESVDIYFTIPQGTVDATGSTGVTSGKAATITIGTVTTGAAGSPVIVTNSGIASAAVFNFTIPQGATGADGKAATIAVGTVTTGAPGSAATVTNSGTTNAAVLNFVIPQGEAASVSDATETVKGIVQLASTTEVTTGTDTTKAVTPAGLAAALVDVLDTLDCGTF